MLAGKLYHLYASKDWTFQKLMSSLHPKMNVAQISCIIMY